MGAQRSVCFVKQPPSRPAACTDDRVVTDLARRSSHTGDASPRIRHSMVSEPECCALCLQALADKQLAVCTIGDNCRVCPHYFHFSCLRRVHPRRCPQCRATYERCTKLPNITKNVFAWARLVAVNGRQRPQKKEIVEAIKAMLPLASGEVESLLDSFSEWRQASDPVTPEVLSYLAKMVAQHTPKHDDLTSLSSSDDEAATVVHQMPAGASGHSSSNIPGETCSCGCIHVHRGDRVTRGPAWRGGVEDGRASQLGTIVREEERFGAVFVQWDESALGDVHCHAWPADPASHEVVHVSFEQISPTVQVVQNQLGVTSAAAIEHLRALSRRGDNIGESSIASLEAERPRPQVCQRCRILPDRAQVRAWFDSCPACVCTRPDCRGGVQWNAQAAQHLGREAYILKMDESDGTVLVEMAGRCNCKVWYPVSAVQPIYDPDTIAQPRFRVGTLVESKIGQDWLTGTIKQVWWRPSTGWGNRPSAPYSIKLLDGRCVFAPKDSDELVRAASY